MKFIHKTAALLSVALALASAASAQTTDLYIAGATTYRAPVHQAICDLYGANAFTFAYSTSNPDGSGSTSNAGNAYKANAAVYSGTVTGIAGTVVFHTYFTGSASGVLDLAARNTFAGWMANTAIMAAGADAQPVTGGHDYTGSSYVSVETAATAPDCTLSDVFAANAAISLQTADSGGSGAFTAIHNNISHITDGGVTAGSSHAVGLIAFKWVLGRTSGTQTTAANMNWPAANNLIGGGSVRLSFLTGNTADNSAYVLLVGRNEDSGTRINAFAEAQQGFGNPAFQYQLTFNGSLATEVDGVPTGNAGSTVTGFDLWPASWPLNTEPSISWATIGHSGYIAGGDVKAVLSSSNPVVPASLTQNNGPATPTAIYFGGYLGIADAGVGGNSVGLTWNGVPFSVAAVADGSYTFWGYEHLYYLTGAVTGSLTSTTKKTAADKLADMIFGTDADVSNANSAPIHAQATAAGILLNGGGGNPAVTVTRSAEGAVISSTF